MNLEAINVLKPLLQEKHASEAEHHNLVTSSEHYKQILTRGFIESYFRELLSEIHMTDEESNFITQLKSHLITTPNLFEL